MTFSSHTFIDAHDTVKNFARVLCLLVEKGTVSLQRVMENNLPSTCTTLEESIEKHREEFEQLRKDNVIGVAQMNSLGLNAPAGSLTKSAVNPASFDMSLWFTHSQCQPLEGSQLEEIAEENAET